MDNVCVQLEGRVFQRNAKHLKGNHVENLPSFTDSSDVFLQKGEMKRATRSARPAPGAEKAAPEKVATDDKVLNLRKDRCGNHVEAFPSSPVKSASSLAWFCLSSSSL
jgi:hypothetical protein